MANLGKTVIVAALDGTFQRKVSFLCVCVCVCVSVCRAGECVGVVLCVMLRSVLCCVSVPS